jgi:hypothetical protein
MTNRELTICFWTGSAFGWIFLLVFVYTQNPYAALGGILCSSFALGCAYVQRTRGGGSGPLRPA